MSNTPTLELETRRRFLKRSVLAGSITVVGVPTLTGTAAAATIRVPEDYSSIQAAVDNAAPGDTVVVNGGTYVEEVTITKDLTLRGQNSPTIESPDSLMSRGIVRVEGSVDVEVRGFEIDGAGNGDGEGDDFDGILYQGASGTIRDNSVVRVRDDELKGNQRGVGIVVRGGGTVDIKDNVLEDYQKNGIVIQNAGTTAEIKRNTVVGAGVTDIIGQNGIQMSGGAEGAIQDNDVRDHVYEDTGQVVATGVLLFGVDSITVQKNSLTNTEIGVASLGSDNRIIRNRIDEGSDDDWGILLFAGDNAKVTNNTISHYTIGIQVAAGSNNKVIRNRFTNVDNNVIDGGTDTKVQPN
ncbi:nitrous oxide reductase family maturation protein NosD [Halomicroarcula sp. GCM10025324]|uniref:right-handed parallel beta-helix repeat-containing protein n=1 Tax=Haloarcula TaxID=2237 RepID=UPI0023E811F9|nr:right-handed parallel beta-helix repeat-containing protein [Halomicroarcula sp. ZS-22-S1]